MSDPISREEVIEARYGQGRREPKRRGSGIWIPSAVLLVMLAAYGAYWLFVREQAMDILGAQAESLRQDGYAVSWSDTAVGGFPFRVTMTLDAPSIAAPPEDGGWNWSADALAIHALPFDLRHVIVEPAGEQLVRAPGEDLMRLTADNLRASFSGDAQGVNRISIVSGPAVIEDVLSNEVLATVTRGEAHLRRAAEDASRYDIFAAADQPTMARFAASDSPQRVLAEATVTAGDVLARFGAFDRAALIAWSQAGGALNLVDACLAWASDDGSDEDAALAVRSPDGARAPCFQDGAAAMHAEGQVQLDREGRWNGEIDFAARRPAEALNKLANLGAMDPGTARQAGMVAQLALGSNAEVTLPVRIRAGEVFLFGFKVTELDPAF